MRLHTTHMPPPFTLLIPAPFIKPPRENFPACKLWESLHLTGKGPESMKAKGLWKHRLYTSMRTTEA